MQKAYIVGTCDTKFDELQFVRERLHLAGVPTQLVDVGIFPHDNPVDFSHKDVAAFHPQKRDFLTNPTDRGEAIQNMAESLSEFLLDQKDVGGVIGLGGGGGTSLICHALRALPIGLPKVMVSTLASGNVAPFIGASDIFMLYSVTDVAGINAISNQILSNAAHALAGMLNNVPPRFKVSKPALAMSMFGVTTPCVTQIRQALESDYECLVFHATGTGGQSMEKLIDSGYVKHVIDITTTEVCDLLFDGILSAGEDRMGAIIRTKIPYIGSVGALDMVNFGGIDSVPEKYKNRLLYKHNAQVTLMRTTKEENIQMGKWIADKLNQMEGPVRFLLPEGGVSGLDAPGQPFENEQARTALIEALEETVETTSDRQLIRHPAHINDPAFAALAVSAFKDLFVHTRSTLNAKN